MIFDFTDIKAWFSITAIFLQSNESTVAEIIWPLLKDEVSKPWEDQSLDSLMFLLSVSSRFPGVVKNKMVSKWLGFPLLSSESMQHFAQRLVVRHRFEENSV